jgi:ATP-dependent exoDNAse (exonuclease V) beta subunit
VDRVVLVKENGVPRQAHVLDFKTDAVSPEDEEALAAHSEIYRPQLEIYRKAMTGILGLDDGAVTADLVFLLPGRVVRL